MPVARAPQPAESTRILVIEDEQDIADLVGLHLADLPAVVTHLTDGESGLRAAIDEHWSAIVLDLRLPGMSGLDLCRSLRAVGRQTPVLMLTARGSELDRVLGLELGADDYLTKPFSVLELVARIRALLRRARVASVDTAPLERRIAANGLLIDRSQRKVVLDGAEIGLTAREFDLLWHFACHPGRVFTRSELLADVWGYGHDGYEHTVNSHINRLRSKLGDEREQARFIHTVWGVGYRFGNGS